MKTSPGRLLGFDSSTMKLSTEVTAGLTTFLAMSYILAVNPSVLGSTGMDKSALFTSTALAAVFGTVVMAFVGRLPLGLAPGMGLNAFFAYTVCGLMGYSWQFALTAVLIEGVIFLILAASNLWKYLVDAIPSSLRNSIGPGIGIFIAFLGLKEGGVIVDDPATLVTLGDVTSGAGLLSVIGLAITGVLVVLKVPGSLLIGIAATTAIGIPLGITKIDGFFSTPPSIEPVFLKFETDPSEIFSIDMLTVVLTFLFVDLFDNIGTLLGICSKSGLYDENGRPLRMNQAFITDALACMAGAALGTSTVTTTVESASGVAQGGRSGVTALSTALCFAIALFFSPVFLAVPGSAVCPVLVIVGLFMLSPLKEIDFDDYPESIPAYLCFILIPLTYSISNGILIGLISYVVLNIFARRFSKMTPLMYFLAGLSVLKFVFL